MHRTYHFQVDNGLFVAEYYLKKDYKKITTEDLRSNINLLAGKLHDYNKLSTLSYSSHLNSALTQGKVEEREERIKGQLMLLLNSIGEDRTCIICGEKRVNTRAELPYSSLIYGTPSPSNFMNRGNNLRTVDICPVCLFLSLVGFLNTQKISYPFLYISDSDEFMRDITEDIQQKIGRSIMLDIKSKDMAQHLIPTLTELMDMKESEYEGLNYINLIQYANAKKNQYKESVISKKNLNFIREVKYEGLINEFYNLKLFKEIMMGNNLYNYLAKNKIQCSIELYEKIKEVSMGKEELKLIEIIASKLVEKYGAEKILKELKLVKKQEDMRSLFIGYTKDLDLGLSLSDLNKVIQKYQLYRDYITIEIQIKNKGDK